MISTTVFRHFLFDRLARSQQEGCYENKESRQKEDSREGKGGEIEHASYIKRFFSIKLLNNGSSK